MFTAVLLIIAAYVTYKLTGHLSLGPNGFSLSAFADRVVGALWPQRRVRRLTRRVLDAVHRQVMVGVSGTVLVPDRIEVGLAESDFAVVASVSDWFKAEVVGAVDALTVKRGWQPHGPVTVTVSCVSNAAIGGPDVTARFTRGPAAGNPLPTERSSNRTVVAVGGTVAAAAHLVHGDHLVVVPAGGDTTVGRDEADGCQLAVADPMVSRRHANVRFRHGILEVTDLGSSNGTFVNDQRVVGATRVVDGDVIMIGREKITVRCPDRKATQRITKNLSSPQRTEAMGR